MLRCRLSKPFLSIIFLTFNFFVALWLCGKIPQMSSLVREYEPQTMSDELFNRRVFLHSIGTALGASTAAQMLGCARINHTAAQTKMPVTAEQCQQVMRKPLRIPAWYYQHYDADFDLDVPEEGFGGWKKEQLDFSREHTAVVVMHAWDLGTKEQFPGWWRAVPYARRSETIVRKVFPPLLEVVRKSELPLFHIVGGADYYKHLPGYKRAVALAGPEPKLVEKIKSDPIRDKLDKFRKAHAFPGLHNKKDIDRGFSRLDFPDEVRPQGKEGVAENGHQLFALCKEHGINHLIYCGFAINWCMLLSPGGMAEMQKYGLMCSVLREATTAVENKDTARRELCKEIALWRVAIEYGFVFDVDDFIAAVST